MAKGRKPARPGKPVRHDEFFGLDLESMSPRAQAVTGLVVGGTVLTGVALVLALHPEFFWLVFVFGWVIFPALGLFARGVAGLAESGRRRPGGGERELLEVLGRRGEITPVEAAMETSLTVREAERLLKELAEGGHLDVRVRGGGLSYSLWGREPLEGG
ncbi:hypothetical protein Rxycam_02530 [Rubrobacter xylanophilus DSM 9941]|uniref:Uncharacterized protein n=1 Tax=Rubrobacter xylanophilus TaxID=49319 RepID=A0A510HLU3_9ACTN|nr:hypothetical protein [Rubrobacter xylanophilus]QYJ16695.1 hypothetical protein Rxycam_02530 [Rubrobacter xylanophilus DSM 9941]BBL81006.1 hypothetical protein RxyAA322_28600 [Rubrobacter xylanophilus]